MFFNIYDKKESLDSTDASLCLQNISAYDMKSGSGKAWCCRRDECELALQRMLCAGGRVFGRLMAMLLPCGPHSQPVVKLSGVSKGRLRVP